MIVAGAVFYGLRLLGPDNDILTRPAYGWTLFEYHYRAIFIKVISFKLLWNIDYIIVVLVIIWYTINEWYVIFSFILPDVQYHFHGMNPDDVVIHAYNMLYFILENDNPVGDGDTISGLENGELDSNVQWTLHYEDSLIQPVRPVLDVNMGEYASGTR